MFGLTERQRKALAAIGRGDPAPKASVRALLRQGLVQVRREGARVPEVVISAKGRAALWRAA